jgi:hypothetical protein
MRFKFFSSFTFVARSLLNRLRLATPLSKRMMIGTTAAMSSLALTSSRSSESETSLSSHINHMIDESEDMHPLSPSSDEYIRIDQLQWNSPDFKSKFLKDNALHDTLNGEGMIETFQVFQHKTNNDIYCIVKFGDKVNGYPGVVHGGISSLVLDTLYGWTFMANKLPAAFTANLNVNFR